MHDAPRTADRFLAAGLAAAAGCVDSIGFLKLGGLFVSFMSGNSTRMAVGFVVAPRLAMTAGCLIAAFVAGVVGGTLIGRKAILLMLVAVLLGVVASDSTGEGIPTPVLMAAAMGLLNTVFTHEGEVSIGVTYMTGTLVKFGQHLAGALTGGRRWAWLPHLLSWSALVGGAIVGAFLYPRFGMRSVWLPALMTASIALYAARTDRIGTMHGRGPAW